jgi:hypothetical protein
MTSSCPHHTALTLRENPSVLPCQPLDLSAACERPPRSLQARAGDKRFWRGAAGSLQYISRLLARAGLLSHLEARRRSSAKAAKMDCSFAAEPANFA